MWKIHRACYICCYKNIISLGWEKITVELFLTKLQHQPLLSFAISRRHWVVKPNGTECWKNWIWLFYPGNICYINMNQSLFLLFHYLRTVFLEDCYFVLDRRKKLWRRVNSIFLWKSKLNSFALVISNLYMLQDEFHDIHLIQNKLKQWYVFFFKFSDFVKTKSLDKNV